MTVYSCRNDAGVGSIEVLARVGSRHAAIMNQTGGIEMRNRTAWVIVSIVLVCVLALVGTVFVVAATHGGFGAGGTAQASVSQVKPVFGATHVYMRGET